MGDATILSPEPTPAPESTGGTPAPESKPIPNPIYGDLAVKWPEGTDDEIKTDPSIKPFVDKDGNISYHNVLKSYAHTKKQFGKEKLSLPTENSPKEEVDEFYKKLYGYEPEYDNYKIETKEEDNLHPEFSESIRKFAHENKLSPKSAQNLYNLLNTQAVKDSELEKVNFEKTVEDSTNLLKKEWGNAYEYRVNSAKKVIEEYLSDDADLMKAFQEDPRIGSNPLIVKILGMVGAKLYKEGTFGDTGGKSSMTPVDVERQIAAIMGDSNHAYHKYDHPEHQFAQKDMLKLFELRQKFKK